MYTTRSTNDGLESNDALSLLDEIAAGVLVIRKNAASQNSY
jgi:hypothetical protein